MDNVKKQNSINPFYKTNSYLNNANTSFLANANNEVVFLWQNFECSGKIEDYLRYKSAQKELFSSPSVIE